MNFLVAHMIRRLNAMYSGPAGAAAGQGSPKVPKGKGKREYEVAMFSGMTPGTLPTPPSRPKSAAPLGGRNAIGVDALLRSLTGRGAHDGQGLMTAAASGASPRAGRGVTARPSTSSGLIRPSSASQQPFSSSLAGAAGAPQGPGDDPYEEFKQGLVDTIVENRLYRREDLSSLFSRSLRINEVLPENHRLDQGELERIVRELKLELDVADDPEVEAAREMEDEDLALQEIRDEDQAWREHRLRDAASGSASAAGGGAVADAAADTEGLAEAIVGEGEMDDEALALLREKVKIVERDRERHRRKEKKRRLMRLGVTARELAGVSDDSLSVSDSDDPNFTVHALTDEVDPAVLAERARKVAAREARREARKAQAGPHGDSSSSSGDEAGEKPVDKRLLGVMGSGMRAARRPSLLAESALGSQTLPSNRARARSRTMTADSAPFSPDVAAFRSASGPAASFAMSQDGPLPAPSRGMRAIENAEAAELEEADPMRLLNAAFHKTRVKTSGAGGDGAGPARPKRTYQVRPGEVLGPNGQLVQQQPVGPVPTPPAGPKPPSHPSLARYDYDEEEQERIGSVVILTEELAVQRQMRDQRTREERERASALQAELSEEAKIIRLAQVAGIPESAALDPSALPPENLANPRLPPEPLPAGAEEEARAALSLYHQELAKRERRLRDRERAEAEARAKEEARARALADLERESDRIRRTPKSRLGDSANVTVPGVDVDALSYAIAQSNAVQVMVLIDMGAADPNRPLSIGPLPLFEAVHRGDLLVVQALVHRGADVNAVEPATQLTALMALAAGTVDHPGIVEELVRGGARVGSVDSLGRGALAHAALNDRPRVVEALLRAGAEIDQRDHRGETPLITAAVRGSRRAIAALLAAGADPHAMTIARRTAVDLAHKSVGDMFILHTPAAKRAAVTIQRVVRGRQSRLRTAAYRRRVEAARVIQRAWRNYVAITGVMWAKVKNDAAVCIQRHYRGYIVRARARRARAERQRLAAVTIQAAERGRQGRRRADRARERRLLENRAATTIQRRVRGMLARARVRALRELRHRRAAAVVIQRVWRGKSARNDYERQKKSVVQLQSLARGRAVRQERKRQGKAATDVQRVYRGHETRARAKVLRSERERQRARELEAVFLIQRYLRGWRGRARAQAERGKRDLAREIVDDLLTRCFPMSPEELVLHIREAAIARGERTWLAREREAERELERRLALKMGKEPPPAAPPKKKPAQQKKEEEHRKEEQQNKGEASSSRPRPASVIVTGSNGNLLAPVAPAPTSSSPSRPAAPMPSTPVKSLLKSSSASKFNAESPSSPLFRGRTRSVSFSEEEASVLVIPGNVPSSETLPIIVDPELEESKRKAELAERLAARKSRRGSTTSSQGSVSAASSGAPSSSAAPAEAAPAGGGSHSDAESLSLSAGTSGTGGGGESGDEGGSSSVAMTASSSAMSLSTAASSDTPPPQKEKVGDDAAAKKVELMRANLARLEKEKADREDEAAAKKIELMRANLARLEKEKAASNSTTVQKGDDEAAAKKIELMRANLARLEKEKADREAEAKQTEEAKVKAEAQQKEAEAQQKEAEAQQKEAEAQQKAQSQSQSQAPAPAPAETQKMAEAEPAATAPPPEPAGDLSPEDAEKARQKAELARRLAERKAKKAQAAT
jgi:hypothetical protein